MENVRCNICDNNDSSFFWKVECVSPKQAQFTLVRCNSCGLIYLNPRPNKEEMAEFYTFWPLQLESRQNSYSSNPLVLRAQMKKLNLLKKQIKNKAGRLLDVGTGSGEFLAIMRGNGWQAFGVEYAQATSNFAREILHLNVLTKDLLDTHFDSGYFDLVTLWDSLEHLHQPKETLIEVNRILKDDGILVLSIPNIDNLSVLVFRNFWFTNAPRHLYQFSTQTITLLLEKAKFRVFRIVYNAGYFDTIGFTVTFKSWFLSKISKCLQKTPDAVSDFNQNKETIFFLPLVIKNILRLILECIFCPFSVLSVFIKKSPKMTVFARKC